MILQKRSLKRNRPLWSGRISEPNRSSNPTMNASENLLYVGRWVTADAVFGQLPADVTHLRFVTGSMQQQLNLAGVIGHLTIDILED
jgi:hypothetical protein